MPPRSRATGSWSALPALVAVLCCGVVCPSAALAQAPALVPRPSLVPPGPRVAVLVVSLDPRAAARAGRLEAAAEASLARAGRFVVVPVQDAASPAAARTRGERLLAARTALAEGQRALDDLDTVKATEAFTAAVEALEATDVSRTFSELTGAWLLRAASHATGREPAAARRDLEMLLALKPSVELSSAYFPAELQRVGEGLRKAALAGREELQIRTEPPGAQVWVDGTPRGASPVTVRGLAAGRHFVSAALGGFQLAQGAFSPGEALLTLEPAQLAADWRRAQAAIAATPDGPARDEAATLLGRRLGLEQLVVLTARAGTGAHELEVTGLRLDLRDGHHAALRASIVDELSDALDAQCDALVAEDAPRDERAPVARLDRAASPSSRLLPTLAIAGAAVAALTVGVVFGSLALDRAQLYGQTPQVAEFLSRQLGHEAWTFALVADVSFLVALAAAATSAVVWWTAPRAPREGVAPAPGAARVEVRGD